MNTPESPPAGPIVPVGIATKLGASAAAFGTLFALVAAVLNGDHTPDTLGGLAVAALSVYAVVRGRSDQAAAALAAGAQSAPAAASSPREWAYTDGGGSGPQPAADAVIVSPDDVGDRPFVEFPSDEPEPDVHPTTLGPRVACPPGHGGADLSGGDA